MTAEAFRYATARDRRDRLVQFVVDQGYSTIGELSRTLGVSDMTIRRDVAQLARSGKVRSFRGGVGSLPPRELTSSDYSIRYAENAAAKQAIAARALAQIDPHSVIAIDAGTTAVRLAQALPDDLDLKVITNSYPVVTCLMSNPGVEVNCLGGTLHRESLSFEAAEAFAEFRVDTLFLAASGLSARGAFCGNSFDAVAKRRLTDVSERVVLLADSSKFSASAMVKICGWDVIDLLVVDAGLPAEQLEVLANQGVVVEIVDIEPDVPVG